MGLYHFVAGSTAFILLLNLAIVSAPSMFQTYTGVNTSQLQEATNVSVNVEANQTESSNVVEQAGDVVGIYTNFKSGNIILSAIGTVYLAVLAVALVDLIWIG